jgi:hypothetical protein
VIAGTGSTGSRKENPNAGGAVPLLAYDSATLSLYSAESKRVPALLAFFMHHPEQGINTHISGNQFPDTGIRIDFLITFLPSPLRSPICRCPPIALHRISQMFDRVIFFALGIVLSCVNFAILYFGEVKVRNETENQTCQPNIV